MGYGLQLPNQVLPTAQTAPRFREVVGLPEVFTLSLIGLAFVGPTFIGHATRPLLVISALATAAYLIIQGKAANYISFVLWLWVVSALLRRIIDWQLGFQASNMVLLTPHLASMLGIASLLTQKRWRLPPQFATAAAVVAFGFLFGTVVGIADNGFVASVGTSLDYLAPLALATFLGAFIRHHGAALIASIGVKLLVVIAAYGLFQWVIAPAWDTAWLAAARDHAMSFGKPAAFEIRVFSTLGSPLACAFTLGAVCVLAVKSHSPKATSGLLVLSTVAIGLTQVRAVWFAVLLAGLALLVRGHKRLIRTAVFVGVALVIATTVSPTAGDMMTERLSTVGQGVNDGSFRERAFTYASVVPEAARDLLGAGMGGETRAIGLKGFTPTLDSSYLSLLVELGPLVGLLVLVALVPLLTSGITGVRSNDPQIQACAAYSATFPILLALGPILTGIMGVIFWTFLLQASRKRVAMDPSEAPAPALGIAAMR